MRVDEVDDLVGWLVLLECFRVKPDRIAAFFVIAAANVVIGLCGIQAAVGCLHVIEGILDPVIRDCGRAAHRRGLHRGPCMPVI